MKLPPDSSSYTVGLRGAGLWEPGAEAGVREDGADSERARAATGVEGSEEPEPAPAPAEAAVEGAPAPPLALEAFRARAMSMSSCRETPCS
jgi:hypothetical protein